MVSALKTKHNIHFIAFLSAMAIILSGCGQSRQGNETSVTENPVTDSAAQQQQRPSGKNLLVGEWMRTDAPYQIKIAEAFEDGKLNAGYLNPKSIHIGKANWTDSGGLKVYIELQDENYPGSNYNLIYGPARDMLSGEYYQAVEKATYQVAFVRIK